MDLTHDKLWKEIKCPALWDNDYLFLLTSLTEIFFKNSVENPQQTSVLFFPKDKKNKEKDMVGLSQ